MAALGSVLVPLTMTIRQGFNPLDVVFAFTYLVGIVTIIWLRVRGQARGYEATQASEAKFRELVEQVPAIVYASADGPGGAWTYVSPRVETLLGFPAAAWIGDARFWESRVHPDDRDRVLTEKLDRAISQGGHPAIEYRLVDLDGRAHWVRDEAAAVAQGGEGLRWSGFLIDVTDRKAIEGRLEHQAFHDHLTGLANLALFTDRIGHALSRSSRRPESLGVLFLDLDGFKNVNDGMGHDAGDELLVGVADRLQRCLRPMDTAARLGGDEFGILLEDLPSGSTAGEVADRILAALAQPFSIHGRDVVADASIGITGPSARSDTPAELLRNADVAWAVVDDSSGRVLG